MASETILKPIAYCCGSCGATMLLPIPPSEEPHVDLKCPLCGALMKASAPPPDAIHREHIEGTDTRYCPFCRQVQITRIITCDIELGRARRVTIECLGCGRTLLTEVLPKKRIELRCRLHRSER